MTTIPKKTRLNTRTREDIIERLIDRKYDPLEKENAEARKHIALAMLRRQLTDLEWAQVEALPAMWLPLETSLTCKKTNPARNNTYENLPNPVPLPAILTNMTMTPEKAGDELWGLYVELVDKGERYRAERKQLTLEVRGLLLRFTTVEAAVDGWPEAADIIREVVGAPAPTNLPMLTTINEALDLPPEG